MHWLLLILTIPYIYIILRIYSGLRKITPFQSVKISGQFVSVIIACRNEEENINLLLNDISVQDYDQELYEVIVVDDSSYDKTFNIASAFRGIRNLRILKNEGAGKKQAIRTGVAASSGELIITTDADCRMGKEWLGTISAFYSENKPDMIICPVMLEGRKGFFQRFQELEYLSLQGVTAGTALIGNPVMCNGANMAFRKDVYLSHYANLRFEILSGDDVFLLHSLKREEGSKILWIESHQVMVKTGSPGTIGSFIGQRVRWISKAGAYKDRFTRLLAIVTFVTILLEWFLVIAGFFNPVLFPVLLALLILKSIPDFLVLQKTCCRYKRKGLIWLFLPSQIVYPFYVMVVFFLHLFTPKTHPARQ